METLALLALIGLTAFVFRWLGRRLSDDGTAPAETAQPDSINSEEATTIRKDALLPISSSDPILEPSTVSEPDPPADDYPTLVTVSAATADTIPEKEQPLPSILALTEAATVTESVASAKGLEPETPPEPVMANPYANYDAPALSTGALAGLFIAGLVLIVATLRVRNMLLGDLRAGTLWPILLGATTVVIAGNSLWRHQWPGWFGNLGGRLANYLNIAPGQLLALTLAVGFSLLARQSSGNGLLAHQPAVAILAWITAIALAIFGSMTRGLGSGSRRHLLDRTDWIIMAFLFVGALLLRGVATAQFPTTFSGDEGSAALFAVEMLNGQANNLFGLGWFSFPSLYFALLSPAIALGGQTVEAVRLTSAVAGALGVVALYTLGRAMFDRTTALLAAAYLAAAHYHIHMSRLALNNIWDGLFAALAMGALWWGWRTGQRGAFILCGLALGLGQYFYVTARTLPLIFLLWAAVAWWRARPQFRLRLPGLIVVAFVALIVFLPLGLHFAENPDDFRAPLQRTTIFDDHLEGRLAAEDATLAGYIGDQALMGLKGYVNLPLRGFYEPGAPILLTGAAILFVLGLLWGLWHFDLRYLLLSLPILATIVGSALSVSPPTAQRYVLSMPSVALFVALPAAEFIHYIGSAQPRYKRLVLAGVAAVMAIIMLVDVEFYFNRVFDKGGFVLGGANTLIATDLATYLSDHEVQGQDVYFFGFPRMGYRSHSTVPYLAPGMNGQDVIDPLSTSPEWELHGPTIFVFLPERLNELDLVRQSYPNGRYQEFFEENGNLLFAIYET